MTIQQLFTSILRLTSGTLDDFELLNSLDAPNSWTVLNKHTQEVWKVITPKALKYKDRFGRFLEKEMIDKIPRCPNVIRYIREGELNVSSVGKLPYLVFPYVEGSPLDKEIRKRKNSRQTFGDDEIEKIAKELTIAIHLMFKNGVIHQDIKPGNILLKNDGSIVVLDLGIARFVNEDLKMIKRMQGAYAYLSPERLDMIADFSEFNKRKANYPSDLFSVGMILFELATLERVVDKVQPGEIRTIYQKLPELGVRDSLVSLISGFLHQNPLERQQFIADLYGIQWFSETEDSKQRFWLQHHSNGFDYIEEYLKDRKQKGDFGVILAGDQIISEKTALAKSRLIKQLNGICAVDPAVFRLAFPYEHHGYLTNRSYGHVVSPNDFLKDSLKNSKKTFVSQVLDFQVNCEADILISPYFIVDRLSDQWLNVNFEIWKTSKDYVLYKKYDQPLYFGLMLSERLTCNKEELNEVISQILFEPIIKNVYLRLESDRDGSEPNENMIFLKNLRYMVKSLSLSKRLLLSFAGLEAFGYLGDGLSSFGINPDYGKRKQQIIEKYSKPKKKVHILSKRRRYFAQELWNEILAEVELLSAKAISLGSNKVFKCNCPHCFHEGKDKRLDTNANRKHFLYHIDQYVSQANLLDKSGKKVAFIKKLELAKRAYNFLERDCKLKFDHSTDGSFIEVWQEVFKD